MQSFNQLIPLIGKRVEEVHGKFTTPGLAAMLRLNAAVGTLLSTEAKDALKNRIGETLFYTCNYCHAENLKYPRYIDMTAKPEAGVVHALGNMNRAHYHLISGKGDLKLIIEGRDGALCQFATCLHNFAKARVTEDDLYLLNIFWNGILRDKR
jgi:hypothetical protein